MLICQIRQSFVLYDTLNVMEQRNPTKQELLAKFVLKCKPFLQVPNSCFCRVSPGFTELCNFVEPLIVKS